MSIETLKDSRYKVIGYIETKANGDQVGKDARYAVKGYYDAKANQTKDARYKVVGKGNLLATLIVT